MDKEDFTVEPRSKTGKRARKTERTNAARMMMGEQPIIHSKPTLSYKKIMQDLEARLQQEKIIYEARRRQAIEDALYDLPKDVIRTILEQAEIKLKRY